MAPIVGCSFTRMHNQLPSPPAILASDISPRRTLLLDSLRMRSQWSAHTGQLTPTTRARTRIFEAEGWAFCLCAHGGSMAPVQQLKSGGAISQKDVTSARVLPIGAAIPSHAQSTMHGVSTRPACHSSTSDEARCQLGCASLHQPLHPSANHASPVDCSLGEPRQAGVSPGERGTPASGCSV